MVQIAIDLIVNVRKMTESLHKALPSRNTINRHTINNVKICA